MLFMKPYGKLIVTDNTKIYKTFIVHLQRAEARKAQVRDLLSKVPYEVEVIDAVDGAKLSADEIKAYYSEKPLFKPAYPFALNVGEMGCFLSHRKVWQAIVDQNLDGGLIFEDDVQIDSGVFAKAVELAERHVQELGYIQFQVREISDVSTVLAHGNGAAIVQPTVTPLRTSGQFVSRSTAQDLLELTPQFDRPIDTTLQMYWQTGLHLSCVVPSGTTDNTGQAGGSTLSKNTPLTAKIQKEWKRMMYRRAVARYSKKAK
jgi:GR25 family glycosyltransferase involved in LPS biosynthesis